MNTKDADNLRRDLFEGSPVSQGPVQTTGFAENFQAGLSVFVDEEMSISRYIHSDVYEERNRYLDKLISRGEIDPAPYATYARNGIDYSKMAYDAKRKGVDVRDDYDVRDALREELKAKREYAEDIHSRAGFAGAVGTFAGVSTGAMLDPINVGAMFIVPPLAMVRTGSALARAGKAALFYGSVTAGTESIIQASYVTNWKKHIGVEYSFGDALTNVAFAAVGSGAIGAIGEVGAYQINRGFKKLRENINKRVPDGEREKLITEVDSAEREYNAHVKQFRIEQKRLQALADLENQPLPGETEPAPANFDREDFDESDVTYSYEEYEDMGEPDIVLTEEDFRTDNIIDGDFETEEDFLRALETEGPADAADVIDLETARANKNFEEDIARSAQELIEQERKDALKAEREALVTNASKNLNHVLETLQRHRDGISFAKERIDAFDEDAGLDEFTRHAKIKEFEDIVETRQNKLQEQNNRLYEQLFKLIYRVGIGAEIDYSKIGSRTELDGKSDQDIEDFLRLVEDLDYVQKNNRLEELATKIANFLSDPEKQNRTLAHDRGYDALADVKPGEDITELLMDLDGVRLNDILGDIVFDIWAKAGQRNGMPPPNLEGAMTQAGRYGDIKKVWDAQTDSVIARIEEVARLEERILFEEDDMLRFETNDPEYDTPGEPKESEAAKGVNGNPWEDFDEGEWLAMTQEQRDAYLAKVLGEDVDLDGIEIDAEVGIDPDGNPLYQTKSRAEVNEEIDDMIDSIEQFKDCWDSPDE